MWRLFADMLRKIAALQMSVNSAGSTLPHLWPTGSSRVSPSITARYFSSCPSDSPHGGHPALRGTTSSGSSSALAVSSFRLRARLDFCLPSAFSGQRGITPVCWIWRSSFERQRDLNPPEQRAAQHALSASLTSTRSSGLPCLVGLSDLTSYA